MTVDHIFITHTIVQKYKKLKTPVYSAFIDFTKAFDTVWTVARCHKTRRNLYIFMYQFIRIYYLLVPEWIL